MEDLGGKTMKLRARMESFDSKILLGQKNQNWYVLYPLIYHSPTSLLKSIFLSIFNLITFINIRFQSFFFSSKLLALWASFLQRAKQQFVKFNRPTSSRFVVFNKKKIICKLLIFWDWCYSTVILPTRTPYH